MQSRTRILHITAVPMTAAILVAPIANRQAQLGYEIEFTCGPGEHLSKLRQLGYPVNLIPISRRLLAISHFSAIYQLWSLLRRRRYHVVHTHTPVAGFLSRVAAALAGTSPIVIYHMRTSWWDSPKFVTRAAFTALEWIVGHWTSYTFTINCTDANELNTRNIAALDKVSCLHCGSGGVDTLQFSPSRLEKNARKELRRDLGLEASDVVVGFVGRLVEEKGIIDLLNGFRIARATNRHLRLLVVGDTPSSERDQSVSTRMNQILAEDHQLARRVIFTGFRDDIPNLIACMDFLVLPSYREGFGMVLAEAAASARPVIATNTRGAREAIIPGENGLVVPIGDVNALSDAIQRLADDPKMRERMGVTGRRIALARFDERIVFKNINKVYERLLCEKGLPIPTMRAVPK